MNVIRSNEKITGTNIQAHLECKGTHYDPYWVVVYTDWRRDLIAEYVSETREAGEEFIRKNPTGTGLHFRNKTIYKNSNPILEPTPPTPSNLLQFEIPDLSLHCSVRDACILPDDYPFVYC